MALMGAGSESAGLRIFISYRRDDASGHAGRLYDALAPRFGAENVFMDAHNELLGLATGLRGLRRVKALAYSLLVGTRTHPGPLLALERAIRGREGAAALGRARAATGGRLRALRTSRG